VSENRFCIAQERVEDKSNEITAIPAALDSIDITDTVVMTGRDFDCHENGSIFYQPMLSDIIYCIKDRKVNPFYKLQNKSGYRILSEEERKTMTFLFGKKDDLTEKLESGYIIPFGNIIDADSYVYTAFGGRNNDKVHLFYNKKIKKSIVFDSDRLSKDESISNIFLKYIGCAKGDVFYMAPSLYRIDKALPEMSESKLKTFLENTDMDDNPVIISFSIKFPEDTQ
jgi:predicted transposase YbfD/YdcC